MKKQKLALFLIISICIFISCNGSGNTSNVAKEGALPPVKASINLRLGQLSKASSPVAVSAALENGESIVIFNQAISTGLNTSVSYNNSQNETLFADFDVSGRPAMAETEDAQLTFTNYTKTTVDVTIKVKSNQKAGDLTRTLFNQPIDPEALNFLDGDTMIRILLGLDGDADSGTRALLAAAFSSLKLVSCTSIDIIEKLQSLEGISPGILSNVSSSICRSQLLESVEEILDKTNYQEITVTQLNSNPACDLPFSFDAATQCAVSVGEQNVIAAENGFVDEFPTPTPEIVTTPTTPPAETSPSPTESVIPTPTSSPTPTLSPTPTSSPTPTPPPNSLYLGSWTGTATGSTLNTGCRNYTINFNVTIDGDNTCTPPTPCRITGSFFDDQNFINFPMIDGTVDNIGHFVFVGTSVGQIPGETLMSDGNFSINGDTGNGNFTITFGMCSGTVSLIRPN